MAPLVGQQIGRGAADTQHGGRFLDRQKLRQLVQVHLRPPICNAIEPLPIAQDVRSGWSRVCHQPASSAGTEAVSLRGMTPPGKRGKTPASPLLATSGLYDDGRFRRPIPARLRGSARPGDAERASSTTLPVSGGALMPARRHFGSVIKLPSDRYEAAGTSPNATPQTRPSRPGPTPRAG